MTLTDRYFQSIEACSSFSELRDISDTLQKDFVTRVHNIRMSRFSRPVRECCDYIDFHMDEEELSLASLADILGYSVHYLGHRFKAETGTGFSEYVRLRKLERAKLLLRDTSLSVKDVSDQLHFCSPSYFSESFRSAYGTTPTK